MQPSTAILSFSQSEKIKAGLLWATQSLEILAAIPERSRKAAEKMARTFIGLMLHDIHLSTKVTRDQRWQRVEKHVDMALVIIDSGVAHEAAFHMTKALSEVTRIGQESMGYLKDNGLL